MLINVQLEPTTADRLRTYKFSSVEGEKVRTGSCNFPQISNSRILKYMYTKYFHFEFSHCTCIKIIRNLLVCLRKETALQNALRYITLLRSVQPVFSEFGGENPFLLMLFSKKCFRRE